MGGPYKPLGSSSSSVTSTKSARELMIYRKWSLLTGPMAILGGVVATVVVANFIFVENDPFLKRESKKSDE